ncbi:hypothetical protein Aple_066490 [Acrocarpospora pleiomorpha]|uniref:Condensation domain-containing protein n=1 Tax=Acrocarpospora pleiomorpha TaxID=90975 RepID=A0A5M3XSH3_9ACTN|nr:condensation domain-containing protein [Acrocarpospora pleiomorpha]GES23750.1 hypothetical protein Aple_066490 [Acrocarpospora pleiomorpha]
MLGSVYLPLVGGGRQALLRRSGPVHSKIPAELAGFPARVIPFQAVAEGGEGPLTWAQQHMFALMEQLSPDTSSVNLRFTWALRRGVSEQDVLAALRELVEDFDALRTVYVPPPYGPGQRVLREGELVVPVIEAEAAATAADGAAATMWSVAFDVSEEWPIRFALVTSAGVPKQLVVVASHLVLDQTGGHWVRHHLRDLLARPPAPVAVPEHAHRPLDEAEWEKSDAGRRHGERAVAWHAETLRVMPQTMLPRPAVAYDSPRYRYLQFDSPALAMAVSALAARHQVSPASVLYAGVSAIAGHVSGLDRSFLQLTVGNRIAPRTRFAVGMHTQDVPVCIDLLDISISDLIARSGVALTRAARFGPHPPGELAKLRHEIEHERGISFDLSCWLNYRQLGPARPHTPGKIGPDALDRTIWRWLDGVDSSTSTYFVFADDAGNMLRLTLLLDAAILPPEESLAWLRGMERLLCTATTTEIGTTEIGEHTGLEPARRDGDWHLTKAGWAHMPSVTELVRNATGARQAEVAVHDDELVATLIDPDSTDLQKVHAACMDALPGMRVAMAPHRYVIHADAHGPAENILAEGTGRFEDDPLTRNFSRRLARNPERSRPGGIAS